jgi:cytochrome c oxidase subunit 1
LVVLRRRRDHAGELFRPGGAAKGGWTSYTPLSVITDKGPGYDWFWNGQNLWLIGFIFLITSSLLGAVNFVTTVIQLRAKGLTWMRLPFFVWTQFITAFILLLAFPPLEAAAVMQLMDRLASTSFFMPTGLVVNGAPLNISGGGSSLLWQHLFWFLGHPEVYVLILPAMGIVGEIIANNTRKPLWGYKSLVFAALVLSFLSFIVWAHHMWLTGMGTVVSAFFQTTTLIISIPSVIILSAFFISLWGGSIRFNTPMLFSTAFLPMFGIGGLTGIPARVQLGRSLPARHLLRDRALPLHRGAGDHLRALCRRVFLVPESHRAKDERVLGQGALLAVTDLYERHLPADVPAGNAEHAPPLV